MNAIKKNMLTILGFLLFIGNIQSQTKKIDSLKNELKIYTNKDTVRVKILNHLAYYHYRRNPSQSLSYANQAAKLADEIKSVKGKARSFYMKGITYMEQGNYDVAITNYKKAIHLYTSIDDLKSLAGCYNALGVLNKYRGNQKIALEYYKKALAIDQKLGIKKNMPNYLYNMGSIYSDMEKHNEALTNFKKALKTYTSNANEYGMLSCLNSMAIVYANQGNYPLAVEYNHKSLEISKKSKDSIGIFQSFNNIGNIYRQQQFYDKALVFYKKALAIKQAHHNSKSITAIKNNIGGIYVDKEEFASAIAYFKETIKLSREIKDNDHLAVSLNGLGFGYLGIKKYSEALDNFQEANKITTNNQKQYELVESYIGMACTYYYMKKYDLALINAEKVAELANKYNLLKHQRDAQELLFKINNELGEHKKAFLNNQQLKVLNDSLFSRENIQKIAEVEYEYKYKDELDSAEKRELRLTQTVRKTTHNLERSQRNLLLGVIAFLVITLILGGVILILKLRNSEAKNKQMITEQKLLRTQMTPHFIFNALSVLQGMILNEESRKSITYLSKFSKLLRITLENSRDKLVSMEQELMAVENYLALQNIETEYPFSFNIDIDSTIDKDLFSIPPMLIQPFVENAIEHGFVEKKENKEINIQLIFKNKQLSCIIKDNGLGIDTMKPSLNHNKKSLATTITKERLQMLSKEFKVASSLIIEDRKKYNEQGTIVTLLIPYIKEDA